MPCTGARHTGKELVKTSGRPLLPSQLLGSVLTSAVMLSLLALPRAIAHMYRSYFSPKASLSMRSSSGNTVALYSTAAARKVRLAHNAPPAMEKPAGPGQEGLWRPQAEQAGSSSDAQIPSALPAACCPGQLGSPACQPINAPIKKHMLPKACGWRSSAYTPLVCRRRGTCGLPMKLNCSAVGVHTKHRMVTAAGTMPQGVQASQQDGRGCIGQDRRPGRAVYQNVQLRLTIPTCSAAATATAAPNTHMTAPGVPV